MMEQDNELELKRSIDELILETQLRRQNKVARVAQINRSRSETAEEETAPNNDRKSPLPLNELSRDKLELRLTRAMGRAIADFDLIQAGDRILVAISGGKDSWALLHILDQMRRRAPVQYELIAVNIDQGYSGFRQDRVEDYVAAKGYTYHMEYVNIAKAIEEKMAPGATPCSLCARLRRGTLYGLAEKYGCNKIALGHHLDDFIETFLLNSFFVGRLAAMAPKLAADDGANTVIRPLVYASEAEIQAYVKKMDFPVVCCNCPIMCGETVHGDYKRRMIKKMIGQLETVIPQIRQSLLASLGNVSPSHLLDTSLWDFTFAQGPYESALPASLATAPTHSSDAR